MTERMTFAWRVVKYGFLLFLIAMLGLFVMSFILGSEQPIDYPVTNVAVGVLLGAMSYWFVRRLKVENQQEALRYGLGWMIIVAAILLAIAIPNQTTAIVFGNWSTYLLFLSIPAGAWLAKRT